MKSGLLGIKKDEKEHTVLKVCETVGSTMGVTRKLSLREYKTVGQLRRRGIFSPVRLY